MKNAEPLAPVLVLSLPDLFIAAKLTFSHLNMSSVNLRELSLSSLTILYHRLDAL